MDKAFLDEASSHALNLVSHLYSSSIHIHIHIHHPSSITIHLHPCPTKRPPKEIFLWSIQLVSSNAYYFGIERIKSPLDIKCKDGICFIQIFGWLNWRRVACKIKVKVIEMMYVVPRGPAKNFWYLCWEN